MTYTFSSQTSAQFGLLLAKRSILGFPSAFAAFKWLDATAVGPCSFIINNDPNPMRYFSMMQCSQSETQSSKRRPPMPNLENIFFFALLAVIIGLPVAAIVWTVRMNQAQGRR